MLLERFWGDSMAEVDAVTLSGNLCLPMKYLKLKAADFMIFGLRAWEAQSMPSSFQGKKNVPLVLQFHGYRVLLDLGLSSIFCRYGLCNPCADNPGQVDEVGTRTLT